MDRRFLTVVGVSLLFALVISGIFYQLVAARRGSSRPQRSEMREVVVATKPLSLGRAIKAEDVSLVKVPVDQFPQGGFSKVAEIIERPVISSVLAGEPVREGRLGARGSGLGLASIIPVGMRAVAVRVNDVGGVAGFVLPGIRVDVLVTGRPPGREGTITKTALQNILVLSAGQNIEPDARGQPINTPVVTLLVTPEQAETLTLAGNEGRIQLVLRNSGDQSVQATSGREVAELYGLPRASAAKPEPTVARRASAPKPAPVVAPPPPATEEIVVIRGNQRTVEVVRAHKAEVGQP
jgi:pilus assembly protein CpaB